VVVPVTPVRVVTQEADGAPVPSTVVADREVVEVPAAW
jgi:hypothetical protein